jgi:hypothetical protein
MPILDRCTSPHKAHRCPQSPRRVSNVRCVLVLIVPIAQRRAEAQPTSDLLMVEEGSARLLRQWWWVVGWVVVGGVLLTLLKQ